MSQVKSNPLTNVAGIDMSDLYPAEFPSDIPTAELEIISLSKLLQHDENECQRMFQICKDPGFFYLDLKDHPEGVQLLADAVACCRSVRSVLPKVSIDDKRTFKPRDRIGVIDTGYFTKDVLPDGEPRYSEALNIPMTEMFADGIDFKLPSWLDEYEALYRKFMVQGNKLANIVFTVLERCLQLPPGTITSAHKLKDASSDFIRLQRYTGLKPGKPAGDLTFPAHTDAISLAILFTWLGGLQIPSPDAVWLEHEVVTEESWRWVKPIPGTAVLNIGDALQVLTNKVLKSALHRVVRAPGQQAPFDRYSVLIGTRPKNTFLMAPFQSPMIPELTAEQKKAPIQTSDEWGTSKLLTLGKRVDKLEENNKGRS